MYKINKIIMKEAYREYEKYLMTLGHEEKPINFEEFVEKIENNSEFFEKYGKNCAVVLTEEERIKEWCNSIGKDISYGENMTHKKLDSLRFKKYKLV